MPTPQVKNTSKPSIQASSNSQTPYFLSSTTPNPSAKGPAQFPLLPRILSSRRILYIAGSESIAGSTDIIQGSCSDLSPLSPGTIIELRLLRCQATLEQGHVYSTQHLGRQPQEPISTPCHNLIQAPWCTLNQELGIVLVDLLNGHMNRKRLLRSNRGASGLFFLLAPISN